MGSIFKAHAKTRLAAGYVTPAFPRACCPTLSLFVPSLLYLPTTPIPNPIPTSKRNSDLGFDPDCYIIFILILILILVSTPIPIHFYFYLSFEGGYEEALSVARLRQLGASFPFTRADLAAVPVKRLGPHSPGNSPGNNRGPGGGRSFAGPAKPGAQRILDAMSMATLWAPKVCACVCAGIFAE